MDFLIIDGNKKFREATCDLISNLEHYAENAASGKEGLMFLREDVFDAILLNVNLEKENGLDILLELRKEFPQTLIVMTAAKVDVKAVVEAMRRGAADFLIKPLQRKKLESLIIDLQQLKVNQRNELAEQQITETKKQNPEPVFEFTSPVANNRRAIPPRMPRDASLRRYCSANTTACL